MKELKDTINFLVKEKLETYEYIMRLLCEKI